MEQWTREERYQTLKPSDEARLLPLHEQVAASAWRTSYHVQTVSGLLNDPNGFSYYNGKWHLFYQWFPFGAVHGMKHWYHVASEDLVHWKNEGAGLIPEMSYENYGCFSGSGYVKDEYLYLLYTGNHRDEKMQRIPYQLIAALDPDGNITKLKHPIIEPQEGYTEHQRDPKVFNVNGTYWILLGAQDENMHGKMLLYKSRQIAAGWHFAGELKVKGYDYFGYMVECPCIEKIGDKWVLLFSPQGLTADQDQFRNKYANVYMTGDLDLENLEFIPDGPYQELDRGFDFYAAQTANQKVYENKAVLAGWFGCSDYTYPAADEEGWAGLITLPRELTIENGRLKQRPSGNMDTIKGSIVFEADNGNVVKNTLFGRTPTSCIIRLENPSLESLDLDLFATNFRRGFQIQYNHNTKALVIDKSQLMNKVNPEFGEDRKIILENGLSSLDIFVDKSAVEIFVNDGEYVMSARIFPTEEEHKIRMSGKDINMTIWETEAAVQDDFVLFAPGKEE